MIIVSRAPLRISFGGGGTDLEAYYARFGGFVLSTTIDHYCYAAVSESGDGTLRIRWAGDPASAGQPTDLHEADHFHALAKAAIRLLERGCVARRGISLTLAADLPPGTGLGSSSAMAVALVHALGSYRGLRMDASAIADRACQLEIEQLAMPIGRQDQYASAFGGLNTITFSGEGVTVSPLALSDHVRRALQARLLLFSTGRRHDSSAILRKQRDDTLRKRATVARLHRIKTLGLAMRDALLAADLDGFGRLLDRAWREKRQLSAAISNTSIDSWYFAARSAGALGGKIAGAGGGGFLLLYTPPEKLDAVRGAMKDCRLRELPFALERAGVRTLARLPADVAADVAGGVGPQRDRPGARRASGRSTRSTPPYMEKGVSHA